MDINHPRYDSSLEEPNEGEISRTNNTSVNKIEDSSKKSTPSKKSVNESSGSEKKDSFWLVYLIGIIIVAILAFFGVRAASALFDAWLNLGPAELKEEVVKEEPEDVPIETSSTPAIQLAEEEAKKETPTQDSAETVDKSSLKIKVLNGSGVSGAAQTGKEAVEAAGFTVEATGNARSFSYESTYVYYTSGNKEKAQLVADGISNKYETTLEENSVADGYDALVVIGKK